MSFEIKTDIPAEKLPRLVAPPFRGHVRMSASSDQRFDMLLFNHKQASQSSVVAKALARLKPSGRGIVATGHGFTIEAHALLRKHGALVFTITDWSSSDRDAEDVKVSIAARVKRPL